MTIITYKNGEAAADDLCWEDGVIVSRCQKIFHRKRDGAIIGGTGDAAATDSFILQALKSRKLEGIIADNDNTTGVIFRSDGTVETWDSEKNKAILECDFYALGAGADIALGVMATGGTAADAAITVCRMRGWPAIINVIKHDGEFEFIDVTKYDPIHINHAPLRHKPIRR